MKGFFSFIFSILTALLSVFSPISANADMFISSTVDTYTVIQDFSQAENFDMAKYPAVTGDYSLSLIQIAESEKGQLYVYVYRPSGAGAKNYATEIRLEMPVDGVETSPADYKLQLLSTSGTLDKYVVSGVSVRSDAVRYYSVVQLARAFDSTIDQAPEGDNTASTVAYSVGQTWKAETSGESVTYAMKYEDVVLITDKYVGFVRYKNEENIFGRACDSHFVAFATDRDIDELLQARVYYCFQDVVREYNSAIINESPYTYTYGEMTESEILLSADNRMTVTTGGLFKNTFEWDEIQTVPEFLDGGEDYHLTKEAQKPFDGMQFVLRFCGTDYKMTGATTLQYFKEEYTSVSDVTILELTFMTDGETYDMAAVDNKQSGSGQPINTEKGGLPWWFWLIVAAVVVLVVLLIIRKKRNDDYKFYKRYYKETMQRGKRKRK